MVPAATVILVSRSSSVSTTVSYTSCFMCHQRIKSRHVRSGDLVYETVVGTEEDLVARNTVAAGNIADLSGIFEWTRQSMVRRCYCVHTDQWSRIRAVPLNATAVISMLNYLLCKSSLASEIAVRYHMYHNEIYLIWCSLLPVLIWRIISEHPVYIFDLVIIKLEASKLLAFIYKTGTY